MPQPQSLPNKEDTFTRFRNFLSDVEEHLGQKLGLNTITEYAHNRAEDLAGASYTEGAAVDEIKTLRHLLLAGELVRTHPTIAPMVLNGHEYVTNVLQGQATQTRHRDLFNNALGMKLGAVAKSREELETMALNAIKSGQARLTNDDAEFAKGFNSK
jgi:hypothetical protein